MSEENIGVASAASCCVSLPLPKANYPCLHEYCAEQVSYPPDMLFWVDDGVTTGWLCDSCWDEHDWIGDEIPPKGISLEKEMMRQKTLDSEIYGVSYESDSGASRIVSFHTSEDAAKKEADKQGSHGGDFGHYGYKHKVKAIILHNADVRRDD